MLAPSVRTWPVAALCLMYCGLRTTPVRGEKVAAAYVSIVSNPRPPQEVRSLDTKKSCKHNLLDPTSSKVQMIL